MLIALITLLLIGGSGAGPTIANIKDAEKAVRNVVVDETRREAAIETLEEMADIVRDYSKSKTDTFIQFEKATRSYETTPADLHALVGPEREKVLELQDHIVKLHSELKTHLTEDEWVQMYAALDED
ncbi:MAG: hypothetical protein DRP71_00515 [Verrucomicrobia bacterium]|nr:MAG: hypothetical protein DRP71_00515 [Verrucomicrobiota bacterium]